MAHLPAPVRRVVPATWRALAITRQGLVASGHWIRPRLTPPPVQRLAFLFTGSILLGAGVSLLIHAELGLPPYDVLLSAVADLFGVRHGQAAWIVSASLLAIASVLGRRPSVNGLIFVFMNGLAVDAISGLVTTPGTVTGRVLFVVFGTLVLASGLSLVVHSNATGGPFELLMLAADDRGLDPTTVRIGLELTVIAGGIALGGAYGVATFAVALALGPTIRVLLQALCDHQNGRSARLGSEASPLA